MPRPPSGKGIGNVKSPLKTTLFRHDYARRQQQIQARKDRDRLLESDQVPAYNL